MAANQTANTSPPPAAMPDTVSDGNPFQIPYRHVQSTIDTASPSTQAYTADGATAKCANCAGPANHRCRQCIDGVDMFGKASPTFYCSAACEHKHLPTHRRVQTLCRSQRAVQDRLPPPVGILWRAKGDLVCRHRKSQEDRRI
jgi:hypothetical protein